MSAVISEDCAAGVQKRPKFYAYFATGGIILSLLFIFIWRFSLIGKKTLVFVDTTPTALPLAYLRSLVLHGHVSPLWASGVYGGHPMLAEGQVSYFHPLAMAVAAFADSWGGVIYGLNLYEFLCSIVGAAGMLGLCRTLGLRSWPAAFAAIAVTFSSSWLNIYGNAVIAGSFVWVPWCLWAMEHWLKHPGARSAGLMGAALAGLLQSGYPQTFHGTVLYMIVRLVPTLLTRTDRKQWVALFKLRLSSGLLAVAVCVALAAVQLLPLLELISLSQRRAGIGLIFQLYWGFFTRGLIFSFQDAGQHYAVPSVGSLLVCMAASLLTVFNPATRLFGHLVAGIVLIALGFGTGLPLFRFIYDFFRLDTDYLWIGTIGIGIAAAGTVDALARWRQEDWKPFVRSPHVWMCGGVLALWTAIAVNYWAPNVHDLQYVLPVVAIAVLLLLGWAGSLRFAPIMLVGVLLVECLSLRLHPFRQLEVAALAEPASARAIKAQPGWQDYKIADLSSGLGYMIRDPWAPVAVPNFHRTMDAMSGMTPVIWGLHGTKGGLALPLARWKLADPAMDEEIAGQARTRPGLRLIDLLAVRYISADVTLANQPGFREFWHEPDMPWITENTAALPRFQFYDRAVFVDTPEAALDYIKGWNERVLVVEDPSRATGQAAEAGAPEPAAEPATVSTEYASDTAYRFQVTAPRPGWLFLADANYPGWRATIDGVDSPVFSAQVLGKAVRIPAGQHQVRIEFHSISFITGAWISAIALLLTVYLVVFGWRRPWPTRVAGVPA
jgi:hypothetical protein